jgi:SAM-dependent methyltransferase
MTAAPTLRHAAPAPAPGTRAYWQSFDPPAVADPAPALWRRHCDWLNAGMVERYLPARCRTILKTDLYDEAVGEGLFPILSVRAQRVVGIDLAASVLHAARARYPALEVRQADVRRLPFETGEFDAVVSNSTLDHFDSPDGVPAALLELNRVLARRGCLLISLDNLANPLVAVRNALPFKLLHRIRLVPYYTGWTCGPRRLRRLLGDAGFDIVEMSAVLHCPRAIAVALGPLVESRLPLRLDQAFLRLLRRFELLARLPTRFRSGYFVVALAVKR